MLGRASHIMKDTPGMVVWLGGVEKGGRGEDESSVQLFNKWRNSSALENSLKKTKGRFEDSFSHKKGNGPLQDLLHLPWVLIVFVCYGVALWLDEGVNSSLQKLPAETTVELGNGIR